MKTPIKRLNGYSQNFMGQVLIDMSIVRRWIFSAEDINCTSYNGAINSPKQGIKANVLLAI